MFGSYEAGQEDFGFDDFLVDVAALVICASAVGFTGQMAYGVTSHSSTAMQQAGGFLVVMAGVVVGLPYLSAESIKIEAGKRLPPLKSIFAVSTDVEYHRRREMKRSGAITAVKLERRYAFVMALIGGFVSVYAEPLVRALT